MRMYQLFKRVPFQISGDEALNTKIIAPLLQEFRRRLKGFRFEEGSFKVWIEEADDLQINFIEPTIAVCSFRIVWKCGMLRTAGTPIDSVSFKPTCLQTA